jgi:hypothetical protein
MNLHAENAQLNVIELLQTKLAEIEFQVRNYKKVIAFSKDHADFYIYLQRKTLANQEIYKAWKIFIAMAKLSLDNVKGITE